MEWELAWLWFWGGVVIYRQRYKIEGGKYSTAAVICAAVVWPVAIPIIAIQDLLTLKQRTP